MDAAIPRELASRIAATAAGIEGVRSAVVCSAEGDVLGAARSEEPSKDAALASFVASTDAATRATLIAGLKRGDESAATKCGRTLPDSPSCNRPSARSG